MQTVVADPTFPQKTERRPSTLKMESLVNVPGTEMMYEKLSPKYHKLLKELASKASVIELSYGIAKQVFAIKSGFKVEFSQLVTLQDSFVTLQNVLKLMINNHISAEKLVFGNLSEEEINCLADLVIYSFIGFYFDSNELSLLPLGMFYAKNDSLIKRLNGGMVH